MAYQYKSMCYTNNQNLFNAMASDCSLTTAAGYPVLCSPTTTGYNVRTYTDATTYSTVSIDPPLIPCAYETENAKLLGWAVFGVFVVAFTIRMIARNLR